MRALILVDLQNDFVPGGALEVSEGDQVISVANRLQQCFDLVVATQDWHPTNHGCFAANHPGKSPGDVVELAGLPQILWPIHCVQASYGADFVPTLMRERIQRVFRKGSDPLVDSYSGFFDNEQRHSTGLGEFLRQVGVKSCYVLGLATDYCVKYTALDARRLDFGCFVVLDGCRGVGLNRGDVERALEEMAANGVVLTGSEKLLQP